MTYESAVAIIDRHVPATLATCKRSAVASALGVHPNSVDRLIERGKLPVPARVGPRSIRFATAEVRPALLRLLTGGAA